MIRPIILILCLVALAFCAVTKKDRAIKEKPLSDETPGSKEYDHEAFLGEDEAKEFDELSPEESKRRLGIIVDRMDKDADGLVTEDELKVWITRAQARYVQEDAERQFEYAQKTKDGYMAWEEYYKSTYGHLEDNQINGDKDETGGFSYKKMIKRDEKRWRTADQNGDGAHTLEEFQSFLHPEEFKHMREIVLEETIEDIDKNGDGLIDLDEYIGDMYSEEDGEEPEWVKTEKDQFGAHRDANKDGFLDKEEVSKWILPADYDHVEAEAKHLIHESDEDSDGVLTKEEILNHTSNFVGSQVTNWGDDLKRHDEF